MSLAAATTYLGFRGLDDYQPVSSDSRVVRRRWAEQRNVLRDSASDWAPPVTAALHEIGQTCNRAGWDGEGSVPIGEATVAVAGDIAKALFAWVPKGMPPPDVVPEADGEICFTWAVETGRVFSLSAGEHRQVSFAGQFGLEGSRHGWQPLDTSNPILFERFLREVASYLEKVYTSADNGSPA